MKTTMQRLAAALVLCVCAAVLAGCGRRDSPIERQNPLLEEVRVGIILPLTGLLGEMGNTEKQAIEMALSRTSSANVPRIRVLFEDGKGDNKTVVAAANKLISIDKVRMLITSTSGASMAAQPVAETFNIPLIAFCMDTEIARKSPITIRHYLGLDEESNAIVRYLLGLPSHSRIAILHGAVSAWRQAVNTIYLPQLKTHFRHPILVEEYDLKERDFRPPLAKLKSAEVNVLVILGYGFEYGPLFSQMEEIGIRNSTEIVGGWGFLYTGLASSQLDGIKVAGPRYVFEKGPKGSAFAEEFQSRYGRPPNFDAAFAYELACNLPLIADVFLKHGPTRLKDELVARGKFEGVFGPYRFSPEGNMITETAVGVYRNGQLVSF